MHDQTTLLGPVDQIVAPGPPTPTVSPVSTDTTTYDNGARGRFNAWFFETVDRYANHIARAHKHDAFHGIRRGTIVELGPGVGANFDHLPPGSRLVAVEPNDAMHARLIERAAAKHLALDLVADTAERLPLPDASVDEVVCTLVLCTVDDPDAVLGEVHRVLRPGGTFRFVEHVAAHPASPRRWLQAALARPWSWLFEGCQLCRDTGAAIERAGFAETNISVHRFRGSVFVPVNRAISGVATR